jgi:hypothetical protein
MRRLIAMHSAFLEATRADKELAGLYVKSCAGKPR